MTIGRLLNSAGVTKTKARPPNYILMLWRDSLAPGNVEWLYHPRLKYPLKCASAVSAGAHFIEISTSNKVSMLEVHDLKVVNAIARIHAYGENSQHS